MPSISRKQQRAAQIAGTMKAGRFPASKAGTAVQSMAKMPMDTLIHFMKMKESLSVEEKKKLLYGLKLWKKKIAKENAMTLSPQEPMWISEEEPNVERNVIAKTFTTNGDFDPFVNQNRGIQFAPKEIEAIRNFKKIVSPTAQDPFFVRFEGTDNFGNNTTTVIKKHRQGNQLTFTAFTKHDKVQPKPKPKPEIPPQKTPSRKTPSTPMINKPIKPSMPALKEEETMPENQITITKTITFQDETKGADILADFLRKLDL